MSTVDLQINQRLPVYFSSLDSAGNPSQINGQPTWAVQDSSLATLQVAADGLSVAVNPTGKLGSCFIQASANVSMSGDPAYIVGMLTINFIAGPTVSVILTPGAPVNA